MKRRNRLRIVGLVGLEGVEESADEVDDAPESLLLRGLLDEFLLEPGMSPVEDRLWVSARMSSRLTL